MHSGLHALNSVISSRGNRVAGALSGWGKDMFRVLLPWPGIAQLRTALVASQQFARGVACLRGQHVLAYNEVRRGWQAAQGVWAPVADNWVGASSGRMGV